MTNYTELKRLAERASLATPWYYLGDLLTETIDDSGDAAYIAAASPDVVLGLIKSLEHAQMAAEAEAKEVDERNAVIDRLRTQNRALREALKDLDNAHVSSPSCQTGLVTRCICITCSIKRTRAALAQAEGGV